VSHDHCAPVLGLVGGIGSGKSALAVWVSKHAAIPVLDGDKIGHQALCDSDIAKQILDHFPQARLDTDTTSPSSPPHTHLNINRAVLAGIVFGSDPEAVSARSTLESILHPQIRRSLEQQISEHQQAGDCEAILVDAAVLFEAGWDDLCHRVVFIDVPADERVKRVTTTRGWTANDLASREASQWSLDRKRAACHASLLNTTNLTSAGQELLTLLRDFITSYRDETSTSCP